MLIVAISFPLIFASVPRVVAVEPSGVNTIVNPGFENPDQAWRASVEYGGGQVTLYDTSRWNLGNKSAKLHSPTGGGCVAGTDTVRAETNQLFSSSVYAGSLANSPDSFSTWWYAEPSPEFYSIHAGIALGLRINFTYVEYFYGKSQLTNSSDRVLYDLGPVPATGAWFQTRETFTRTFSR